MDKFEYLVEVLEKSAAKYGPNKVLTIRHLANILAMVSKNVDDREIEVQKDLDEVLSQIMADQCCDRD